MTTSVIQKLFEVPVNQSNVVFELNELSQSEGINETVLKTFTTAEAFAALITKVNPVISGTASVANMSLNLSDAREQLATSGEIEYDTLLELQADTSSLVSAALIGLGAAGSSAVVISAGVLAGLASVGLTLYALTQEGEDIPEGFQENAEQLVISALDMLDDVDDAFEYFLADQVLDNEVSIDDSFIYLELLVYGNTNLPNDEGVALRKAVSAFSSGDKKGAEGFIKAFGEIFGVEIGPVLSSVDFFDQVVKVNAAILERYGTLELYLENKFDFIDLTNMSHNLIMDYIEVNDEHTKSVKYAALKMNGFALHGQGLYDDFDTFEIDDQFSETPYWEDRSKFLELYLKARLNNKTVYTESVEGIEGEVLFYDQGTGKTAQNFYGAPILMPEASRIVFASELGGLLQGNFGEDRLYGSISHDTLVSNNIENTEDNSADELYGGDGDDTYYIGGGDYAEDTEGFDFYRINSASANGQRIVIHDKDGFGGVMLNDERSALSYALYKGENLWSFEPYSLSMSGSSLIITDDNGNEIEIKNFEDGDLGIKLGLDLSEPLPVLSDLTEEDDNVNGTVDNDHIDALGGNDTINSYGGDDVLNLGSGNDTADAGEGNNIVDGGSGDDLINAGSGSDQLKGGSGNDRIVAGGGDDIVEGEVGVDILVGGDGADQIFAGLESDFESVAKSEGTDTGLVSDWLSGGEGDDLLVGDAGTNGFAGGAGDDTIYGGAGRDIIHADSQAIADTPAWLEYDNETGYGIYTSGFWNVNEYGNDTISAGSGDDFVSGQGGSDIIDGGDGADEIHGDVLYTSSSGNIVADEKQGTDVIYGGAGNDKIYGDGALDYIWGGEGDDHIEGDSELIDEQYHGNDLLYGGAGNDEITGQGGADHIEGGTGNDTLFGDMGDNALTGGNDTLVGGEGNDNLLGEGGDDTLLGGLGDDHIEGDAGNDHLTGGQGLDYLVGGTGQDTYYFELGDAPIVDGVAEGIVDASGEGNRIVFGAGIALTDITLGIIGNDLILYYQDEGVYINNGMLGVIDSFQFNDSSTTLDYKALIGTRYTDPRFELGTAEDDLLIGGSATNNLFGGQGNDTIVGGLGENNLFGESGNDTLIHQGGSSTLNGGEGDDHYIIHLTDNTDVTLIDSSGANTLELISEQTDQSIYFNSVGDDLVIQVGGGQVLVPNWLSTNLVSYQLPDGSVLSHDDVLAQLNTAPVAVYSDAVEAAEDSLFIYELTGGMFADAEMDDLSFSVTLASGEALPSWLAYDEVNKRLIGTPENDDVGGLSLAITATDPGGFSASSSLDITVQNTNDAPVAVADVVVPVTSSAELKYSVTIAGAGGDTWIEKHGDGTLVFWNNDGWKYQKLAADGSIASEVKTLDLQGAELVRVFSQGGEVKILSKHIEQDGESILVNNRLYEQSVDDNLTVSPQNLVYDASVFPGSSTSSAEVIWSEGDQKGVLRETSALYDYYSYDVVNIDTLERQTVGAGGDQYGFYDDSVSRISDNEVALVLGNSTSLSIEIFNQTVETNYASLNQNRFYLNFPDLGLGYRESYVFRVSEDELIALIDFGGNPSYDGNWTYSELHYSIVNTTDKTYSSLKKVSEFSEQQNVIDVDYVSGSGVENSVFVTFAEENDLGQYEVKGRFISALGEQVGDDLLLSTAPVNDYQVFTDDYFDTRDESWFGYDGSVEDSYEDAGQYGYNTIVRDGEILSVWSTSEGVHISSVTLSKGASAGFIYDPLSNDFDEDSVNVNETLTVVSAVITQGMGSVSIVDGKVAYDSAGAYEYLPLDNQYDIVIQYTIRDSSGAESTSTITTQINGQTDQNSFAEHVVFKPLEDPYYGPITTGDGDDYVYIDTSGSSSSSSGGTSTFNINTGKGKDIVVFEETPYAGEPISTTFRVSGLSGQTKYILLAQEARNFYFDNPYRNNTLVWGARKPSGVQSVGDQAFHFDLPLLGLGSLKLSFEGADTEIHLENFDPNDVLGGPRDIDTFIFNGVTYSYEELVAFGFDLEGDAGDNVITGTSVVDRIYGEEGNDQLEGGEGDDTYYYDLGDGEDLIIDQVGSNKIVFGEGISTADLNFSMIENDLVIAIGDSGQITVQNWETNEGFAIAEIHTADSLVLSSSDISESLNEASPNVFSFTEDEAFVFQVPSDMFGDFEATFITATLPDGQPLPTWLSYSSRTISFSGTPANGAVGELSIRLTAHDSSRQTATEDITFIISNVNDAPEVVTILSDQFIDVDQEFSFTLPDDLFIDVDAGDQISLSISNVGDTTALPAWLSFDTATGTLSGIPALNDVGEFNLVVIATDNAGAQTEIPLRLKVGDFEGIDEILAEFPTEHTVHGTIGNDTLEGGNGDNLLLGNSGNDALIGKGGDDHLIGGRGNDFLNGGVGSDTYYFSRGFGQDMIKNYDSHSSSVDKILFDSSITPSDVEVIRDSSHLVLRVGDDEIQVLYHFIDQMTGNQLLDEVHFADGTIWSAHQIGQMVLSASAESDDLSGYMADEVLDGLAGDDTLRGNDGNDRLIGGLGNDKLYGGEGNDTLIGSEGSDYLKGDNGDDIYLFERGHGDDTIHNEANSDGDLDTVLFADAAWDNLWFSRYGDDLVINRIGTVDKVTVDDWYVSEGYHVDVIQTSDATLEASQVDALVQAMAGFTMPTRGGEEIPQHIQDEIQPVLASSWTVNP